jgi:uncharacterized membrane protein
VSTAPADAPYVEEEASPPLARMGVAVLSLLGLFVSGYLSMYKLGMIGAITCSVGSCERVQDSPWASFLGLPVALWGVGAYAFLFVVALLGLQPRWARARWVAVALAAMSGVGVLFSAYLTYLEARVIEAWCQWCVVSAILVTLIFLLSLPGLRHARAARADS